MSKELITIQQASKISGKSIQTIRRAIKAKKIKFKRQKTPQGFNYLVIKESIFDNYSISESKEKAENNNVVKKIVVDTELPVETKNIKISNQKEEDKKEDYMTKEDFSSLTKALERIISQHSDERQNFLRLINTLNEKVFELEGTMKLLQAPRKKWFQVWKN